MEYSDYSSSSNYSNTFSSLYSAIEQMTSILLRNDNSSISDYKTTDNQKPTNNNPVNNNIPTNDNQINYTRFSHRRNVSTRRRRRYS